MRLAARCKLWVVRTEDRGRGLQVGVRKSRLKPARRRKVLGFPTNCPLTIFRTRRTRFWLGALSEWHNVGFSWSAYAEILGACPENLPHLVCPEACPNEPVLKCSCSGSDRNRESRASRFRPGALSEWRHLTLFLWTSACNCCFPEDGGPSRITLFSQRSAGFFLSAKRTFGSRCWNKFNMTPSTGFRLQGRGLVNRNGNQSTGSLQPKRLSGNGFKKPLTMSSRTCFGIGF